MCRCRHLQRRDRHLRGSRRALRRRQEDRRARAWITASSRKTSSSIRWSCRSARMGTAGRQVFALVRRLREELKVNTSCGAVEHLLRPAAPPRHQRRLPADGDRRGMTSAIMNPVPAAGDGGGARRQRADGHRPRLHDLDQDLSRLCANAAARKRGQRRGCTRREAARSRRCARADGAGRRRLVRPSPRGRRWKPRTGRGVDSRRRNRCQVSPSP